MKTVLKRFLQTAPHSLKLPVFVHQVDKKFKIQKFQDISDDVKFKKALDRVDFCWKTIKIENERKKIFSISFGPSD